MIVWLVLHNAEEMLKADLLLTMSTLSEGALLASASLCRFALTVQVGWHAVLGGCIERSMLVVRVACSSPGVADEWPEALMGELVMDDRFILRGSADQTDRHSPPQRTPPRQLSNQLSNRWQCRENDDLLLSRSAIA